MLFLGEAGSIDLGPPSIGSIGPETGGTGGGVVSKGLLAGGGGGAGGVGSLAGIPGSAAGAHPPVLLSGGAGGAGGGVGIPGGGVGLCG